MSFIKLSCNAPGLSKQKYEPIHHKYLIYVKHKHIYINYLPNPIKHIRNNAKSL